MTAKAKISKKTATEWALLDVGGIGTYEDDLYRVRILRRHPSFSRYMARKYQAIAENDGVDVVRGKPVPVAGYVRANRWLSDFEGRLKVGGTGLFCDCGDERIIEYAKAKARKTELHMKAGIRDLNIKRDCVGQDLAGDMETAGQWAWRYLVAESERVGIELHFKVSKRDTDEKIAEKKAAAVVRAWDYRWWLRRVRVLVKRQFETLARVMGLVSGKSGKYVSNFTYARRVSQEVRNTNYLLELEAVNEEGYCSSLKEMSDAGGANPANRQCELAVRFKGFQKSADQLGYVGLAVTLTAPSKYHAVNFRGRKNAKFGGFTPRDTQEYLTRVWSRVRAEWAREKIGFFGFRIAEPHHDGTPHWHLALYVNECHLSKLKAIFRRYALAEDGDEKNANKVRILFEDEDKSRGNLMAYFMKYISKNITGAKNDGGSIGVDLEVGGDCLDTVGRVVAWATCWGIRQFQQLGGVSVSVYRELRRLSDEQLALEPLEIRKIAAEADAGDWSRFCELMGGVMSRRADQVIRVLYVDAKDLNRYGEAFKKIRGVLFAGVYRLVTRVHDWVIQPVGTYAESLMVPRSGAPPAAV